ncbi:hypothetical protein AB0M43_21710 [Longispora sp. NPDC051575]|uniref:hypothetical protein n=1 Tax=Longispora sp. NPDC051575 TaxID=3154943 RepID=UPI00342AFCD8
MNEDVIATAPMTRAQKFQWHLEKGLAQGLWPLPASTEDEARSLVSTLQARFEILRTSIETVDGEWCQAVHALGAPPRVVQLDVDRDVLHRLSELVEEFRLNRHGRLGELLVEFILLRRSDRHWLAFVADNVAIDAGFHRVLDEEVARSLRPQGALEGVPEDDVLRGHAGWQPREAAGLESNPAGDAERQAAAAYLRRHFSDAPARAHPRRASPGTGKGRYFRCTLTLPGADRLFSRVITTTGLLPSALILSAFAQLTCWLSESDSCSINVSVDNRHHVDLRRTLCATAQRVPVAFRLEAQTVLSATADVQRTLSEGHPVYGRYDPFDLLRERVHAQHRRGVCLTPELAFNFVPPPQGWTALLTGADEPDGDVPSGLPEISTVTTAEDFYEYGASLSVRWVDAHTARLSVHGDSDVISPDQCAALLRGIERTVQRVAAGQDSVVDDVAAEVGLHRPDAGTNRQFDRRWIDNVAITRRLLDMPGVVDAKIVIERTEDSPIPGLVAKVSLNNESTLTHLDLREEMLLAIDLGELLIAPQSYEILGADGELLRGDGHTPSFRRPAVTVEEVAVRRVLERGPIIRNPDLDLCYVRSGGNLDRYPEFADHLRHLGFVPPEFAAFAGMSTLRSLARRLVRSSPPGERQRP